MAVGKGLDDPTRRHALRLQHGRADAASTRRSRRVRPVTRAVATLVRLVLLIVAASVGTFGAAMLLARWSAEPFVFLGGAIAVGAIVSALGSAGMLRRAPRRSRPTRRAVLAILATAISSATFLVPLSDPSPPTGVGPHPDMWQLSTGSELAYTHIPADGPQQPYPIVVLHGGPGIPDAAGEIQVFGQLAELGYDAYVYDQLGAGQSSRLSDPREYGIERDLKDLEQIRQLIGADRMILIGHSYGGALAARYLAAYPHNVDRLVLISPGPLDPTDDSPSQATSGLDPATQLAIYALALQPRALLGYALLQVDPTAAHAYLNDDEADARHDRILNAADRGLHCSENPEHPAVHGSGFYALQYPQSATAPAPADVRPQLEGNSTPVLLFRGECDYLSAESSADYRRIFPTTTFVFLAGAGHNAYQDDPDHVLRATASFLRM